MRLSALVSLSLAAWVVAQTTNDTGLGIEAIEAHFQQSGIVPSLLESFDPSAVLTVTYAGVGAIEPGQPLKKEQVAPQPTITVSPANSTVSLTGNFTLAMVDADKVGTDDSQVTRHWLVNGVTVDGNSLSNASGVAITNYAGPGPAPGSGAHRYVILLYTQPADFHPPAEFAGPNIGVSKFGLKEYVQDSGLGPLVAGMYYTVEEGTATATVSQTSSVVSSTLAPVGGSTSGGSTSGAPQPTNSNSPSSATQGKPISSLLAAILLGAVVLA